MSRTSAEVLTDALHHLELIASYVLRDLRDQLVIDAVCMRLSAGIETLSGLDGDLRERLFGDDWPLMWGLRNRIAHGYLLVDPVIIDQTVGVDVPLIIDRIRGELARFTA